MRHALGYYRAVIVTGRYVQQLKGESPEEIGIDTVIPALKHCIATHPILSAGIRGEGTEAPQFVRPATLDLRNHIEIRYPPVEHAALASERELLTDALVETHDQLFPDVERIPPWKIVLLPLPTEPASSERRMYVLFAFSHSHGDGKSGLAFHRTFLKGLESEQSNYDSNPSHKTPFLPLLPSLEEVANLKITLSYLLGPLIGVHLPKFVTNTLNLNTSFTPKTSQTWVGTPAIYDPESIRTGLEIIEIDKVALDGLLAACKSHGSKFTGLLHQVIVRALSQAVPANTPAGDFVAGTAVDLRPLVPELSSENMALCVSSVMELYPRIDITDGSGPEKTKEDKEAMWSAARTSTTRLAAGAGTLVNQPVGLLRYLSKFRPWLEEQIGKPHDSSYEISNILSFDPFSRDQSSTPATDTKEGPQLWDIDWLSFSQPGNPTSCPLSFQVVSRKGGAMVITVIWHVGTLAVPDERDFVKGIADLIKARISNIISEPA